MQLMNIYKSYKMKVFFYISLKQERLAYFRWDRPLKKLADWNKYFPIALKFRKLNRNNYIMCKNKQFHWLITLFWDMIFNINHLTWVRHLHLELLISSFSHYSMNLQHFLLLIIKAIYLYFCPFHLYHYTLFQRIFLKMLCHSTGSWS